MIETLGIATAKAVVEKIAIAGLKKIYEGFKADYEQHLVPMTTHFENYLKSAYERHSVVSTLVLRNSKRRLKDIYVPLTIQEEIKSLVSKAPDNTYIITSRPEISLMTFGDFSVFTIQPLKDEEATALLRKYDNHGEVSNILIEKLNNITYTNVKDFLRTPLLTSLLFTAFDYKQKVPIRKGGEELGLQVRDEYDYRWKTICNLQ